MSPSEIVPAIDFLSCSQWLGLGTQLYKVTLLWTTVDKAGVNSLSCEHYWTTAARLKRVELY